ncbi:hypothetical protein BDBG_16734 [Blastomyces gilchristii SLH14081]|uniref:Uncharacterized protein n=1 Tax=Blastomyces gilchristii (strain SLH14081) TaxID=559298 RepID=A0A179UG98_BLAGS|nr:uncharacterized protein BDBG_16733 [Blastomyces gilchristii SLH14081]OAT06870.1 hypothetical protein BDBG_16734 [Blastomyces gilchristii SLH14081]
MLTNSTFRIALSYCPLLHCTKPGPCTPDTVGLHSLSMGCLSLVTVVEAISFTYKYDMNRSRQREFHTLLLNASKAVQLCQKWIRGARKCEYICFSISSTGYMYNSNP